MNWEMSESITSGRLGLPPPGGSLPGTTVKLHFVFAANEALPLPSNFMLPYSRNYLKLMRRAFNYRVSRAHTIMENAFGILVAGWCILDKQSRSPNRPWRPLSGHASTCTITLSFVTSGSKGNIVTALLTIYTASVHQVPQLMANGCPTLPTAVLYHM